VLLQGTAAESGTPPTWSSPPWRAADGLRISGNPAPVGSADSRFRSAGAADTGRIAMTGELRGWSKTGAVRAHARGDPERPRLVDRHAHYRAVTSLHRAGSRAAPPSVPDRHLGAMPQVVIDAHSGTPRPSSCGPSHRYGSVTSTRPTDKPS
jgi:hypothetical protein